MSTAAGLSSGMQHNPHFYFEPLTLEVENELFKLPQILFTQCKTFTDLFPDVLNGSGHVVLGDCTKKQFEAFLTAILEPLYRMLPEDHPCSEPLPLDSLLSALELANKWGFDQLSEDLGSNVSAVKKISLGRQHKIVTWFQSGLEELVLSEADISLADAEELGAMFTVRVYHARAAYWRQTQEKERGPGRVVDASAIVEEVFAKELGELAEGSENPPPPAPSQTHSSVPGVRLQPMPTRNAPGPASDDESDDEESAGVPFTRSSTQVLTTGLSDLGSSGGDAMKTVIWAVFGPNPSRTRSLPRLMVTVPKICQKQEGKCGETDSSSKNSSDTDAFGEDDLAAESAYDITGSDFFCRKAV
ncbi:hypothetical protein VNI00_003777 [Paramarasmius palmivorus]|uniref:Uncharacterized protein n=1 Tax=Paramarasmius palmivorus TaxID=297713 RepID=A0AAW0DNM3_9AGAR